LILCWTRLSVTSPTSRWRRDLMVGESATTTSLQLGALEGQPAIFEQHCAENSC
jgi:hypothetical protein